MNKKLLIILIVLSLIVVLASSILWVLKDKKSFGEKNYIDSGEINLSFRTSNSYFYHKENDVWSFKYLLGVNVGLTEATTDLSNPDVTYDTYIEWLTDIAAMNANTIKVFTIMPPQFYDALKDYNAEHSENLYLLQGIWFDEDMMYNYNDAYDDEGAIGKAFKRAAHETIDITHGNSDYTYYGGNKKAVYKSDVSLYVAGYILGLEWDSGFVNRTNELDKSVEFNGDYLSVSSDASVFEMFLCEAGNALIDYESKTYSYQTPVAFLNWQSTDPIKHSNEPFVEEDLVSVDTEHIRSNDKYHAGQFAAFDIYPYYPEFMNYQPEYIEKNGDSNNSYRAYLNDLIAHYNVPVIVAEFGIPTSRGVAHESVIGMNQGGVTEQQQGKYIVQMAQDIIREGYAGAIIFSWQDEWFKQTWNTIKYSPLHAKTRTPNVQSAEQSYGLLAMEPGEKSICLIDDNTEDWNGVLPVVSNDIGTLYSRYDEAYLYLRLDLNAYTDINELIVPISISGRGSENSDEYGVSFNKKTDFLLIVKDDKTSYVICDSYESVFDYKYPDFNADNEDANSYTIQGTGKYVPINQLLSNEIVLPLDGKIIEAKKYQSGLMTYGITDPDSEQFNSNADFIEKDGIMEFRIPWYILNVMNSTTGTCLNDFYKEGKIDFETFSDINIGLGKKQCGLIYLETINYEVKKKSTFHTRLKKSYNIIRDAFSILMK